VTVSKENIAVIYREGDSESLEFAQYYQTVYDLNNTQLISVPCSDTEILQNETDFNNEVLNPIYESLYSSASEVLDRNIWVILLGYNVPGGFRDGNDIISSTSRLSRLNFSFEKKLRNNLYNRKVFQRFTVSDAQQALIVSRIDAPTLSLAKEFVNNALKIKKQSLVNGKFYFDPYSDLTGTEADGYEELMLEFQEETLPDLNLTTFTTTFIDPYIDSVIPFVQQDSFVWSWFTDRASSSFFRDTNTLRGFFYNADYDAAYTIRDIEDRRWCFLAMQAGYISTAGAMSNPTIEGFLNLRAFFIALLNDATIGEGLLFSTPYLDWTISFFGDPLVKLTFPVGEPVLGTIPIGEDYDTAVAAINEVLTEENEAWRLMSIDFARSMAYLLRKEIETKEARQFIVDMTDVKTEVALLYPTNALVLENSENQRQSQLSKLMNTFIEYPQRSNLYSGLDVTNPTINDYLSEKKYKISKLISSIIKIEGMISPEYTFDEGYWSLEFILEHNIDIFVLYHFILEVEDSSDPSNNIYVNSANNISNWYYEKEENEFVPIPLTGVPSSFKGRRIKYESPSNYYLTRASVYVFKINQTYINESITDICKNRFFTDIIWS